MVDDLPSATLLAYHEEDGPAEFDYYHGIPVGDMLDDMNTAIIYNHLEI